MMVFILGDVEKCGLLYEGLLMLEKYCNMCLFEVYLEFV